MAYSCRRGDPGDAGPGSAPGPRTLLLALSRHLPQRLPALPHRRRADGAPIDERAGDALIGTTLGAHYVIDAYVGEGAMGRVYRAHHARLQRREFAVKVLLGDLASTLAMRLRFAQEAEAASALDHPNVVTVTDVGRSESGLLFLVMDFVDGPLLSARIAQGPIPVPEVITLARGLAEGLAHAHERGLVHRDFKPDNVILADGVPRIVDFGLAITVLPTMESARLTSHGATVGTPAYAAPEQAQLGVADHRADLFALGVTLYEMLAGVLPFVGNMAELIHQNATARPPPIAIRAPGVVVPGWLEAIVRRLMARDPADRFASATEVISALGRGPTEVVAALDRGPTAAMLAIADAVEPASPPTRAPAPAPTRAPAPAPTRAPAAAPPPAAVGRRRRWPVVVGLAAVLSIAAAMVVARRDHGPSPAPPSSPPTRSVPPSAPVAVTPPELALAAPPSVSPAPPPSPEVPAPVGSAMPVRPAPRDPPGGGSARRTVAALGPALAPATPPPAVGPAPTSKADAGVAVAPPALAPSPGSPPPPPPVPPPVSPAAPSVAAPPPLITEARVAITGLDVRGSLSAGQVRRMTDRLAGALASCYGPAATRAGRSPTATVQVKLTLDEDGRARDVGTDAGGLPGLAACVAGVVGGARSSVAPDVGTVAVGFTVTYRPEDP